MKFLRRDYIRYSKIGKNRKKLQKWRRPRGRHNKMREDRKGYPITVRIGFKRPKMDSGKIKGLTPYLVNNAKELEKATKGNIIILGKVGAKKKIELIKKANEMKLEILNLNVGGNKYAAKQ